MKNKNPLDINLNLEQDWENYRDTGMISMDELAAIISAKTGKPFEIVCKSLEGFAEVLCRELAEKGELTLKNEKTGKDITITLEELH
ncbi:MAG: hypothetical protein P8X42_00020 [Calditrichaceae bacterium]|jgi:hypothetical protein